MQLTRYTDYALRTLLFLALRPGGATVAEIASHYGISYNHLVKVANQLAKLGYVNATRGKSGGLKLARDPGEITVAEIVRATEPNFHMVECFNMETNTCPIAPACKLKGILGQANEAFLDVLTRYTVQDVIGTDGDAILVLLGVTTSSMRPRSATG